MAKSEAEVIPIRPARDYRHKVLAHAATKLAADERDARAAGICEQFRAFLKIEDRRLRTALRMGASGAETAAARSFVLDLVAGRAFQTATLAGEDGVFAGAAVESCATVAVGGYGERARTSPASTRPTTRRGSCLRTRSRSRTRSRAGCP